jgi:Zn-dependent protease
MPAKQGTIRLFEVKGIAVFLHWTWFLVAVYEIGGRPETYSSITWNVLEYLALFGIVLLHEFGHAFACRSVGGRADQIVLWPLGGIAYVDPPQRPGAVLWSIAAGPLVNVLLVPVLWALSLLTSAGAASLSDVHALVRDVAYINTLLLFFNVLPVYPLDGGQIVGALLWFVIGRARSMMVSAVIGLVGVAGLGLWALSIQSAWLALIAFFIASRCLRAFQIARLLNAAQRPDVDLACPSCHAHPPPGAVLPCSRCGATFDLYAAAAPASVLCPKCGEEVAALSCPLCRATGRLDEWRPGRASGGENAEP